jgi:hypothetical protein
MREERLGHSGNPDHLPCSKGSTEAFVIQGRRTNRSVFVQATPGTGVREHRSNERRKKTAAQLKSRAMRANLAVDDRYARSILLDITVSKNGSAATLAVTIVVAYGR